MLGNAKVLEYIVGGVEKIKGADGQPVYQLTFDVLNSKNFGVPQNRERLYIVGRLKTCLVGCHKFLCMPIRNDAPPPLRDFLESHVQCGKKSWPTQSTARENIRRALGAMRQAKLEPSSVDMVVDLGQGLRRRVNMMHNLCPTITKSRGGSQDFWLTSLGRRLSAQELLRIQGFDPSHMDLSGLKARQVGMMAGNAMTLPVLAEVLKCALRGTDLVEVVAL